MLSAREVSFKIKPGVRFYIDTVEFTGLTVIRPKDARTFFRSDKALFANARTNAFSPIYADEVDIQARRSPDAWFLEFSNHPDNDHSLEQLRATYAVTDSVTVVTRGQRLIARHLMRRERGPVLP